MQNAPIPVDDAARLQELFGYNILDTEEEEEYDALVDLVSLICGCPTAIITFIDKDRQWFKARKNIETAETLRRDSFCGHAIMHEEVLVVPDARRDARFIDNPFVTGGMQVGFYAGAPIITASGHKLGTVCVLDQKPHELNDDQKRSLQAVARQVMKLLELRVKNDQVRQQGERLINAEKELARQNAAAAEEERFHIAAELHEDFAQLLAATKMCIEFAEQSKDLADYFLGKSKAQLLEMIKRTREISRSLTPTTYTNARYGWFMEDMITEFGKTNNVAVSFDLDDIDDKCSAQTGLNVFRILQYGLKYIAGFYPTILSVNLEPGTGIVLRITHDGYDDGSHGELLVSNMITRAEMLKGHLQRSVNRKGQQEIMITVPQHEETAEPVREKA